MPFTDLPLDELENYRPAVREPQDFDEFWDDTLTGARGVSLDLTVVAEAVPLATVRVYDVTFRGFGGQPIKAWFLLPVAPAAAELPIVVEYVGYGGGRGLPIDHLLWPTAGYAHLVMDTRGQGSAWGVPGETTDPVGSAPSFPGFMTKGVHDKAEYYYRRLIVDAVRAVDAAKTLPGVDPERVVLTGISQGGGLALAVAGLVPDIAAAMPNVPFLCHFERAVAVAEKEPYTEIAKYLAVHRQAVETTFATLSYFDGANFATRATAPALFSVGLMDQIAPASTIFAAYNRYAGPKSIEVYRFNNHEGGQSLQLARDLNWLTERIKPAGE